MTLAQKLYEALNPWCPAPWEKLGADDRRPFERAADAAESALTGSDASVATARASALADLARELVAAVQAERADRKDFEFSTAEAQERKRRTTRLLGKVQAAIAEMER